MTKKDDGGPAFPTKVAGESTSGKPLNYEGMTLRDWFAGQAMACVVQVAVAAVKKGQLEKDINQDDIAASAYIFADAMIAARSKHD